MKSIFSLLFKIAKNPVIKHLDHVPIPDLPVANEIHLNGLFIGNHHYDLSEQLNHLQVVLRKFVGKGPKL